MAYAIAYDPSTQLAQGYLLKGSGSGDMAIGSKIMFKLGVPKQAFQAVVNKYGNKDEGYSRFIQAIKQAPDRADYLSKELKQEMGTNNPSAPYEKGVTFLSKERSGLDSDGIVGWVEQGGRKVPSYFVPARRNTYHTYVKALVQQGGSAGELQGQAYNELSKGSQQAPQIDPSLLESDEMDAPSYDDMKTPDNHMSDGHEVKDVKLGEASGTPKVLYIPANRSRSGKSMVVGVIQQGQAAPVRQFVIPDVAEQQFLKVFQAAINQTGKGKDDPATQAYLFDKLSQSSKAVMANDPKMQQGNLMQDESPDEMDMMEVAGPQSNYSAPPKEVQLLRKGKSEMSAKSGEADKTPMKQKKRKPLAQMESCSIKYTKGKGISGYHHDIKVFEWAVPVKVFNSVVNRLGNGTRAFKSVAAYMVEHSHPSKFRAASTVNALVESVPMQVVAFVGDLMEDSVENVTWKQAGPVMSAGKRRKKQPEHDHATADVGKPDSTDMTYGSKNPVSVSKMKERGNHIKLKEQVSELEEFLGTKLQFKMK